MKLRQILLTSPPLSGHIIPMLELAKHLADSFPVKITFIISATKLPELLKNQLISPTYQQSIRFQPLLDGNQDDYEQRVQSNQNFFDIAERMNVHLEKLLTDKLDYDMAIADFTITILFKMCRSRGIPCYVFSVFSPNLVLHMLDVTENSQSISEDRKRTVDHKTGLPPLLDSTKQFLVSINQHLSTATGVLINSYRELDPEATEKLEAALKAPLKFVGPLISQSAVIRTDAEISDWLDGKPEKSVVYVSFGSMVILQEEQVRTLYQALTSMRRPFIWSLRQVQHCYLQNEVEFREKEHLILSWVPQKQVLMHKSMGIFITHSGWNSTLESIFYGVPMICWPMKDDQHINAKSVVSGGMGVQVLNTELDSSRIVSAEEIVSAVQLIFEDTRFFEEVSKQSKLANSAVAERGTSKIDLQKIFQ